MRFINFIFILVFIFAITFKLTISKNVSVHKYTSKKFLKSDWWETAVIYQIYPRSFKDSNNDGNGDINGITQKLDHIKDMGVDAIWLSPVYKSPQVDNGYDISDFRDVDPLYGTLDDLKKLIDEAHKQNIKVLLDYVPNHSSSQHPWFQASIKRDPQYDDYYVWMNATYENGQRKPPNNWLSAFGGSAWEWNEERQQYYYHAFSTAQPDLNYRNPKLVQEMKDLLTYWLDFGADGFRMDAVSHLVEDSQLQDEPPSGKPGYGPEDYNYLSHNYTQDQNETYDIIHQFRKHLDNYNLNANSSTKIMITEAYSDINKTMLYYGNQNGTRLGAHFPFNFHTFIIDISKGFTAHQLSDAILEWIVNTPNVSFTSNWVLGNHDQPRVATRLGVQNIDGLNILAALLRGVLITFNGEEIGQENGEVTCQEGYDPQAIKNCTTFNQTSRDFERTPFQWNNETNAGFNTGAKPWLPVSQKYKETNLANEKQENINTHYSIYRDALKIRKEFKNESHYEETWFYLGKNVFVLYRIGVIQDDGAENWVEYNFYFNVGNSEEYIMSESCNNCTVAVRSINSQYSIGDPFKPDQPLKPGEAVLFKVP